MKKLLIIAILLTCSGSVFANPNYSIQQDTSNAFSPVYGVNESFNLNNTLKGSVVTVPAGQTFKTVVTSPVNSETAATGENVTLVLGTDFYYNGGRIAPTGSTVYGSVIEVSKAKHGSLNGKLTLRFTQIITPTGLNIPISAVVRTMDNTGTLVGGTKLDIAKNYSKDIAIGAGTGALAGVVISPLSGGSLGKGTALSTAVGAGGGLVKSIWDKGEDVDIPVNTILELVLTQPITVNPNNIENKSFGQ